MQSALDARVLPRAAGHLPRGAGLLPRGAALETRELVDWARYVALHEAVRLPLIGGHRLTSLLARVATRRPVPERNRDLESAVRGRYWALLEADFDNARRGIYPRALLFDVPIARYAGNMPRFLLDAPRIVERISARNHRDLPAHVDLAAYPAYYRRTFHWQTDGYFSQHSAKLYDLGVELLFIGMADVMRRQALAEVVRRKARGQVRLLDVGAGTGRFLLQAASTLPGSKLCGVDLSPWYVSYARDLLDDDRLESPSPPEIDVANAESLPYADNSFDVVTCIFVLHELPRRVRRNVLAEMRRVLAPGGLLVLEDAAQPSDSLELMPALAQFSKDMHEPYFDDYQADDLGALLSEHGFDAIATSAHFVAKVVSGTKALARGRRGLIH